MSQPNGEPAFHESVPAAPLTEAAPVMPVAPIAPPTPVEPAPTAAYPAAGPIPPGYAPVSAPAYPVSAVPAYPVSAMPMGYGYGMEAPPKPKRTGTIVLSIATGLLALVAAGMTTLFFVEHSNRANADKKVTEQTTALTAEQEKAKSLESQLTSTKSDLAKANQDLEGAKGKTADVTKEKEALAACFRAIDTYARSKTTANANAANAACAEASKYY
jgi:hypothetical protein